jgi:putative NADH-flavin reductase
MKITVIGSTGHTGSYLLAEGLRRGRQITAFTRRPQALTNPDALAGVVHGDGTDPDAVSRAVRGADVVIAILGPASRKGPYQSAEVAVVVTAAMQQLGPRRLIVTSAYPLVAERPRLPIAVLRRVFAAAYADAAAMEGAVKDSNLEWTIARFNRLTDAPPTDRARISPDLFVKPTPLARADAAAVLLDLAESTTYLQAAVNIAGP